MFRVADPTSSFGAGGEPPFHAEECRLTSPYGPYAAVGHEMHVKNSRGVLRRDVSKDRFCASGLRSGGGEDVVSVCFSFGEGEKGGHGFRVP